MHSPVTRQASKPVWAWVVLVGGGILLLPVLPATLIMLLMPFWKPDEVSFLSMFYLIFPLVFCTIAIWAMIRAYQAIKNPPSAVSKAVPALETASEEPSSEPFRAKKPFWPWLAFAPGVLLLLVSGPGVVMFLPILPIFLAGMSTDSGTVPSYVPALIVILGYALLIGYVLLVIKAIKALRTQKNLKFR